MLTRILGFGSELRARFLSLSVFARVCVGVRVRNRGTRAVIDCLMLAGFNGWRRKFGGNFLKNFPTNHITPCLLFGHSKVYPESQDRS